MATKSPSLPQFTNFADLHRQLGFVPLERICTNPSPGAATEADALRFQESKILPICELIDSTLIARMNYFSESVCSAALCTTLYNLDSDRELGIASNASLPVRLAPGSIRFVNVGFTLWDSLPGRRFPRGKFWPTVPQLAIDLVNVMHTRAEMDRKLQEFFQAGCKKYWLIDCAAKTVRVHTSPTRCEMRSGIEYLSGGRLLPKLRLSVAELFEPMRRISRDVTFEPSSLPAITGVDVREIGRRGRLLGVEPTDAQRIATLWRQLPPGKQARCHYPKYELRFLSGNVVICSATVCWECNNIHGQIGDIPFTYEFDATRAISQELLAEVKRVVETDTKTSPAFSAWEKRKT